MANIENTGVLDPSQYRDMPEEILMAQNLVQQGAIHAVSFLLQHGCTEEKALQMLASLKANSQDIRNEAKRRGSNIFEQDQIAFN